MAVERTLSIIKPDATRRNLTGKIVAKFEEAGLRVVASRRIRLSQADAEAFYAVHKERPFFKDLVKFMISGPVVVQVLEGEGAIQKNRDVMGATNPANAAPGTIRKEFAESIEANSVHGSDAPETAANEIKFFFRDLDIVEVHEAAKLAVAHVRDGLGPFFLELQTYRFRAHSMFDPELYRDKAEVEQWKQRGPLHTFTARLKAESKLTEEEFLALDAKANAEVQAAVDFAEAAPWEPVEDLLKDVHTP